MKRFSSALLLLAVVAAGCKPYDVPEYKEIDTSHTAFLVPLEGNTEKQSVLESEDFLRKNLVSVKRVQIPHKWHSTGRFWFSGKWVPTVRLITIDRAPITREWVAASTQGTSSRDEAIWIESSDSVGFSTGITCTARISDHDDAIKFLYNYSGIPLSQIMDTEIRARIQKVMAHFAAGSKMDQLREQKREMLQAVEEDVVPFFKQRGITITTIGQFGGFEYEDPANQKAIDKVFQAQQDQQVATAEHKAQLERNKAIKLAADGKAEALKIEAKAKAEAIQSIADAKSYEITKAKADMETYLKLKQLEIDEKRLEKWDGKYPLYYLGGGRSPQLIMPQPAKIN